MIFTHFYDILLICSQILYNLFPIYIFTSQTLIFMKGLYSFIVLCLNIINLMAYSLCWLSTEMVDCEVLAMATCQDFKSLTFIIIISYSYQCGQGGRAYQFQNSSDNHLRELHQDFHMKDSYLVQLFDSQHLILYLIVVVLFSLFE